MADSDVAPGSAAPARIDTSAFGRAMIDVQALCAQLAAAVAARDSARVVYIAHEATSMWSTGFSACRRLVERSGPSSPHADAARLLLEENYMKLLELFEQAARTIDVPRVQKSLGELRITLVTAIAQPFSGGDLGGTHGRPNKGAS